jgi:hypothetical protein
MCSTNRTGMQNRKTAVFCCSGLLLTAFGSSFPATAATPSGTYSNIVMRAIPTADSSSEEITLGLYGDLWFGEAVANNIGRLIPSGSIIEYAVPTPGGGPSGITLGPDGAIWFCEWTGNKIARITTAGVITEFLIPTANSEPNGITTGPDGADRGTVRGQPLHIGRRAQHYRRVHRSAWFLATQARAISFVQFPAWPDRVGHSLFGLPTRSRFSVTAVNSAGRLVGH